MNAKQVYVVLSASQLKDMIRQIEEKKGVLIDPDSGENIMVGVFWATPAPDSEGILQLPSYELCKLA